MTAWRVLEITVVAAGVLLLLAGGLGSVSWVQGTALGALELPVATRSGLGLPYWAGVTLVAIMGSLLLLPPRELRRAA